MQVDPRLEQLQNLIEQKRSDAGMQPSRTSEAPRSANPKFQAALERLHRARGSVSEKPAGAARQMMNERAAASHARTIRSSQSASPTSHVSATPQARGTTASSLTGAGGMQHLTMGESGTATKGRKPHLGSFLDLYA